MKKYYTYILSNSRHTTLYTGVTNDIFRRSIEHKGHWGSKFTRKYNLDQLMYYEEFNSPEEAIRREKQIKAGSRLDKENLINSMNPGWLDLFTEYHGIASSKTPRNDI